MTAKPMTIPVTVVGGFLGAGKTTYLNHLLRTGRSRTAVLVNDFGAVNIDAGLIAKHDGTTMTLTNGCVCCSIGGGFLDTLGRILDDAIPFDHIIIEASGVGDPWRIAEIALVEPSLRLNAVVVLADATRIETLLADPRVGDTVRNQFDRADLVLLTKTDLVGESATRAAAAAIAALRDSVTIAATSPQAMPDLPGIGKTSTSPFRADAVADTAIHEQLFKRWTFRRPGAFDRARLETALHALPPSLLRLKGACPCDTGALLLQMVGRDWSLTPVAESKDHDILLVGVGTVDLPDTTQLDAILDRALAAPLPFTNAHGGFQPPAALFHPLQKGPPHAVE
ncbi:GTP-binding protein [Tardiphaga sp. vice352]|uniref:CobW family GTP-binding protein n=1 Tax=unclassified Tardiphaga TaxID=2631404 RepID=UPI0011656459|nr:MULTISPECIES: GTP-binding protein [unclassified Tardiphaga]QDM19063.1 GTP-binding protein [Tardiphaga sp. vice278]QDM29266.1 GTP-binding protein [Tardiphaga sp. vice304]QDM34365.1 GTP-binding protein [Tardiphaga sp. vice352]